MKKNSGFTEKNAKNLQHKWGKNWKLEKKLRIYKWKSSKLKNREKIEIEKQEKKAEKLRIKSSKPALKKSSLLKRRQKLKNQEKTQS